MSRQRLWILNVALGSMLIFGGLRLRNDWNAFGATHQAGLLHGSAGSGVKALAPPPPSAATVTDWTDIASRSPFSFDRNDINLDLTPPVAAPVAGPRPVLLATLLLGNERLALMAKSAAEARASSRVKVGETFEGWEIVDIQDSAVVVTSNGARESISVGRVPVIRSSEKTTASPPASIANPVAAAPTAPRPAATTNTNTLQGLGIRAPKPEAPPGSRVVESPFGWRFEKDEK
jgi:hypothetical protein